MLGISNQQLMTFFFVFVRISGLFIAAPFFSSKLVLRRIKIAIVFALSFLVFPFVKVPVLPTTTILLALGLLRELSIGYLFGLMIAMIFSVIQIAGRFIDFQLGFAIVNVFDPQSGSRVPLTGQFGYLLTMLVFLIIDGHHFMLRALTNSFVTISIYEFTIAPAGIGGIVDLFATTFMLAGQIAAPVMGALFITSVALGIVARTVPQMNVFVVGMPAKIILGFFVLGVMIPAYLLTLEPFFAKHLMNIIKIWHQIF